jgi:AcrR family transcriptional regulator
MGRPPGSRNADYDQKRRRLARRVVQHLVAQPAEHLSLRELARAAGVSVSTMRHYFGDRSGIVAAGFAEMGQAAEKPLRQAVAASKDDKDLHTRLVAVLRGLASAWTQDRLGRAHAVALAEGVYAETGPHAVEHLLEPFVGAVEQVLHDTAHTNGTTRHAALALVAPVWMLLLHQDGLGGSASRPIDVDAFLNDHTAKFLRGWVPES